MRLLSIIRRLAAAIIVLVSTLLIVSPAAAQCTGRCITPGEINQPLTVDGTPRSFLLHVPRSYTGKTAVPLLIDLHGYAATAQNEHDLSGQYQQSDKRGFVVVYPQGLNNSWNAYGCCGDSLVRNTADVTFIREVVKFMKRYGYIDPARVYVTGLSTGGAMAHRLACEAADVVQAVATVSFPLNRAACTPSRPITVYSIAATADEKIYYGGYSNTDNGYANGYGIPQAWQSAMGSLAAWKRNDGCTVISPPRTLAPGVTEDAYRSCAGNVRVALLTIEGGQHILYKNYYATAPVDVSEYIWDEAFR